MQFLFVSLCTLGYSETNYDCTAKDDVLVRERFHVLFKTFSVEFIFVLFLYLTLYHPPSQKSTVYGRWKKTSLPAKLRGRATLILRYYVIRVLRNAVAASNHIVGIAIEFFFETTSASVFFLVFFLALHTDRVKDRTVMVMS